MCKQSEFLSFLLSESLFMAIVVDIFFLLSTKKENKLGGFPMVGVFKNIKAWLSRNKDTPRPFEDLKISTEDPL